MKCFNIIDGICISELDFTSIPIEYPLLYQMPSHHNGKHDLKSNFVWYKIWIKQLGNEYALCDEVIGHMYSR